MATIEYNGSVVATVEGGNTATLPVKDLKMKSDIVITVPEGESGGTDSPLPIAVSTEAEMTALLTSGEVGGVYKYTGTTGTYESGALYVLENAIGTFTHQYTGDNTDTSTFEFEIGMTWAEWIESDYNTSSGYNKFSVNNNGTVVRFGGAGSAFLYNGSVACVSTDVILENTTYTSYYSTTSGGSGN